MKTRTCVIVLSVATLDYDLKMLSKNIKRILVFRKRKISTNGGARNAYRILVGKPEERRPLGRPKRRWVNNIKMDLREI
jgi:hypothetical protein